MIVVLIGPMGCGKTTVGQLVAEKLGWKFIDADDFHSEINIQKMKVGIPLGDPDRSAWLEAISQVIGHLLCSEEDAIVACSALKRSYREKLGVNQTTVRSIYLKVPRNILRLRVESREHRFINPALLDSQLSIMEEPEDGLTIDAAQDPLQITSVICRHLKI